MEYNEEQLKLIQFIKAVKPDHWQLVYHKYQLNWKNLVLKNFPQEKTILIHLLFRRKPEKYSFSKLGDVYGPIRIMDNVGLAQIRIYHHRKGEDLQATIFHCFAHIIMRENKLFKQKTMMINKVEELIKPINLQIDHRFHFQFTLRRLLSHTVTRLREKICKDTRRAVRKELNELKLVSLGYKKKKGKQKSKNNRNHQPIFTRSEMMKPEILLSPQL
jgi:hypothetical protein